MNLKKVLHVALLFHVLSAISFASSNKAPEIFQRTIPFLVNSKGAKLPKAKDLLKKDFILVYYSAHWCPPCQKFTPKLVEFYNQNATTGNFEIVFASSDQNEKSMLNYMVETKMPWPAIEFKKIEASKIKEYGGKGIPCLVLFNAQGEILSHSYEDDKYLGPNKVLDDLQKKIKAKEAK